MAYATADQVKTALRLPITDDAQDDQIDRACASASMAVDKHCRRTFTLSASQTRQYVPVGKSLVIIDDIAEGPVVVETRLTVLDAWTVVDADTYQLEPLDNLSSGVYWPYTRIRAIAGTTFPVADDGSALVRVTATFGWSTVPADVVEATILQAVRIVKRPDAPFGVTFGELGAVSVQRGLDPDVVTMLSDYVRMGA